MFSNKNRPIDPVNREPIPRVSSRTKKFLAGAALVAAGGMAAFGLGHNKSHADAPNPEHLKAEAAVEQIVTPAMSDIGQRTLDLHNKNPQAVQEVQNGTDEVILTAESPQTTNGVHSKIEVVMKGTVGAEDPTQTTFADVQQQTFESGTETVAQRTLVASPAGLSHVDSSANTSATDWYAITGYTENGKGSAVALNGVSADAYPTHPDARLVADNLQEETLNVLDSFDHGA